MSKSTQLKAALVVLLVVAFLIAEQASRFRYPPSWYSLGLLSFGLVNVLLAPPGTTWVRAIAIAATFPALLWPGLFGTVVIFAWLLWPPAFMVAWALALARRDGGKIRIDPTEGDAAASRARIGLAAVIGAVALASFAYRVVLAKGLQQTAALFVGIPALLAIVAVFAVSPRSAIGVACKAVTVGLLVSLIFLGEGILCVVMSAPLFYGIAIAIAAIMEVVHRRRETSTTVLSCLLVLTLVPMSLEGVSDLTTLAREESIAETRIVHASSADIERALFEQPRFERPRPLFHRTGFPSPTTTRIERDGAKPRWVIQVRGGEMRLDGMEPRAGDLVLELEEARPGLVRWRAVSDDSHMTHFLRWREAIVNWEPIDETTTRVTWTLRYSRDLDPSWYFGPMERYAVRLAAGYLIDAVATP